MSAALHKYMCNLPKTKPINKDKPSAFGGLTYWQCLVCGFDEMSLKQNLTAIL